MRLGKDVTTAGIGYLCKGLKRMMNRTIAVLVCLWKQGSLAWKMGKMTSMVLMDRKRQSGKMEGLGMRTVISRRMKHKEKLENLNTATSLNMKEDTQTGRKAVVLEKGREHKLHSGQDMNKKVLENDDQLVLS